MSESIVESPWSDDSSSDEKPVHNAGLSLLPEKSREKYIKAYDLFNEWRHSKSAKSISENKMLSYFMELSKTKKPSTLWSVYSMLKATIKSKYDIHIEKYSKLLGFIKKTATGHKPKKSKVFTAANIEEFLNKAPDSIFLATKVVLIIGITGACRTSELTYLTTHNIEKHSENLLLVNLSSSKTNIDRHFVIRDEYVKIIEKYQAMRPANTPIDRFFLQYRNGRCVRQPMGCTKIGGFPREVATFLGLQDPEGYTGHCYRRTSATLLAEPGADLSALKRYGAWKSSSVVAEVYIEEDSIEEESMEEDCMEEDSIDNKLNICTVIVEGDYRLGSLLIEGKTKQVYDLPDVPGHCLLLNKDRITAGDGVKAHDLEGKAAISNQTNAKVFDILTAAGIKTAFVKIASPTAFVSKKCEMIPIEWVTRRLATGSFLKRNPGVSEGFRFTPPKQETFFKDDANHDPQWSEEQIVSANFKINGLSIGQDEVDYMRKCTILVFEVLEKAWALRDCALIDMKVEFGVDADGNILLADVIDSDSWRLWPSGDKRLMVDKQVYRNLATVTAEDLDTVKRNFAWVKDQLDHLKPTVQHKVVVFMGSPADQEHCQKIAKAARGLGLDVELRVTSAHKATEETLRVMRQYEDTHGALVFVAVAGRSNGLGPVLSGNTSYPVINCPPPSDKLVQDIWSSLSVPSGLGCATVIYPDSAALMAAQIIGLQDYLIWGRLRAKQLEMATAIRQADKKLRDLKA